MTASDIRPERTIERYSRGLELIRAIRVMWDKNRRLPAGSNAKIAERIDGILAEFDLTVSEWHYWARHAAYDVVPY